MEFNTPLCRNLRMSRPIFGFAHSIDVTAALTNAGGMGIYGAARDAPDAIPEKLRTIRAQVGDKPFGVDIMLPKGMPAGKTLDDLRAELPGPHRQFVAELRDKYGVPEPAGESFFNSMMRSDAFFEAQLDAVLSTDVDFVAFGTGFTPDRVKRVKDAGKPVGALIGLPKHARAALDCGIEVIVAQGTEAGGHTGEVSTLTLIPQIVEMANDVPVVAAGGIGHGSQIAASLAMGAQAVWLGTIWLTTQEHALAEGKVAKLLAAQSSDTVITRASSGKPQRQLRSRWSEEWSAPEAPAPLKMPYQHALVGDLITAVEEADITPLLTEPAGQGVVWCRQVESVAEVVTRLCGETNQALDAMAGMLDRRAPAVL